MDNKNDVVILFNRKRTILLVSGAWFFVFLGFLFLLAPDFIKPYHPVFIRIIGCSSVIFFGTGLIIGTEKLFDKKPGLIINADGIIDNSGGISAGLIPWSAISFIKTAEVANSKFILIGVTNVREITSKQNAFKRFWLKATYKTSQEQISINTADLKVKFDDIEKILIERWSLYKGIPIEQARPEVEKQRYNTDCKLYTTGWIAAATFIGGPLAGFYLLSVNFDNLQKSQLAQKAFNQGIVISLVLFTSLMVLPQGITSIIPKNSFPIIYTILLGHYADMLQGNEIKNHIKNGGKKYSGWKAAGIGIVCLIFALSYVFMLSCALNYIFPEKR